LLTPEQINKVSSPEPTTVELTDILLDAWSLTSITEPMPGRPEVGSCLRGIAEWHPPQTTIAWRAELDLDGFADLELDDVEEWFDTHRILTHETLTVNTSDATAWFKERWDELSGSLSQTQRVELGAHAVIVDRAGIELIPLHEVINRLSRKSMDADVFLRGAQVVVPVSFGGIRRGVGLLDHTEPKLDRDEEQKSCEEQATILRKLIDVADISGRRARCREKVEKSEDGKPLITPLDPGATKPPKYARFVLELISDDVRALRIVSYIPLLEKTEFGSQPETLKHHVSAVRRFADQIIKELKFATDDATRRALELAADWHDHGKDRERWQRLLIFRKGFIKPNEPMGKSGGEMKRDPRGYRHEFGSLREFTDAFKAIRLLEDAENSIDQDTFELAMHLIATHHGRGRPHFPKGGYDPNCEARSDEIHTEAIRRFARLQRKYGWWRLAWLENLLRCSDALASANLDAEDDPADTHGEPP
jgi:CRISPR-associated endonuclease/helicase Cas3